LISVPTAQPLARNSGSETITRTKGFGQLPSVSLPRLRGAIINQRQLPVLPSGITVIRLAQGDPNDVQLRNIASSLGIPAGVIGNAPTQSIMQMEWTDDQGFHWTYHATERQLEFKLTTLPTAPLTVTALPSNDILIQIANDFFRTRMMKTSTYRDALVEPDWNNWWINARASGLCMDSPTLFTIRAIGSSEPLLSNVPASLPSSKRVTCVSPEFPSHAVVRFHALVDGRDILTPDGRFVNGAELVIDTLKKTVVAGRIMLFPDPDRSDYPALQQSSIVNALSGTADSTATTTLSSWSLASMRVESFEGDKRTVYLIPSLVGEGSRVTPDGNSSPARIVLPLLAQ
jgi:hypothetical protein